MTDMPIPRRLHVGSVPPGVALSMLWLLAAVLTIVLAPFLPIPAPDKLDLLARLNPPVGLGGVPVHPLGTDDLGRDILARLIAAMRTSLLLAFFATILSAVLGTLLGILAAHFGGWVDQAVVGAVDAQASVPFVIVSLTLTAFFGNHLMLFLFILSLFGWERFARLSRAMTLVARGRGYVLAMSTLGFSWPRIYLRHVLPNIASSLLVTATINFPEVILLETSLSFLGLGIQPPMSSLGSMVGLGRNYLTTAWWIAAMPAAAIFLSTLAVSLIGDWARARISRS
ncbi:ABC transporter permease [Celeribacter indicus]|uniref:Binding-protein-dependent transport systems inner membrane component n=1 Tax=Celeribacter indicus TaxID=1208324 RepID=A0A0B5DQE8_9RHOB|nr:ABC transporter permease [Celeribacter indicus]AJE45763.1 binding-protein-dependent transport systems inner membrane component [Celeribacter indicus]SDX53256.1 peptide/nickel transport system permease protein [Celeribacter indicus]